MKKGYAGKAECFAVYVPETGKVYLVSINEAPKATDMTLRCKTAGVSRSNGKQNWHVSYEEALISGVKYNRAEDYEIEKAIQPKIK